MNKYKIINHSSPSIHPKKTHTKTAEYNETHKQTHTHTHTHTHEQTRPYEMSSN